MGWVVSVGPTRSRSDIFRYHRILLLTEKISAVNSTGVNLTKGVTQMRVGRSGLTVRGRLIDRRASTTGKSVVETYMTNGQGGRRCVVLDTEGRVLYDTLDCHDLANAHDRLGEWAKTHFHRC
jgi:hypothetical protein